MELQLKQARNEIKNIREQLRKLQEEYKRDIQQIRDQVRRTMNNENDHVSCSSRTDPASNEACLTTCVTDTISATKESSRVLSTSADGPWESAESFPMKPIGWIESMFRNKNGTPRQAGVCPEGRAKLSISRSVFNNPTHSLVGLENFSHIWIIFVFHKNNNAYSGAKVRPPRLDGAKVGIFSSRCPYRPNPVGLTLAKIDYIKDNIIHLRSVDIIDGTPVIDIKPFIPQYDSPIPPTVSPTSDIITSQVVGVHDLSTAAGHECEEVLSPPRECDEVLSPVHGVSTVTRKKTTNFRLNYQSATEGVATKSCLASNDNRHILSLSRTTNEQVYNVDSVDNDATQITRRDSSNKRARNNKITDSTPCTQAEQLRIDETSSNSDIFVADWIGKNAAIVDLEVCFTSRAEAQLLGFCRNDSVSPSNQMQYLDGLGELRRAIIAILSADPRSVYRRRNCADRLYYFSVDSLRVTCWFDYQMAEVLDIRQSC